MATASRHLCRQLARISTRPSIRRRCHSIPRPVPVYSVRCRQLSSTPVRLAEEKSDEVVLNEKKSDESVAQEEGSKPRGFEFQDLMVPKTPYTVEDLDPQERATYEVLSKEEQVKFLAVQNHVKAVTESEEVEAVGEEEALAIAREIDRSEMLPILTESKDVVKMKTGLWQQDEDDEFGQTEDGDDEWSEDLISSVAQSELEVHREIREYTRIAAWDLPLLLQFTKQWNLPDMKKTPLRFRYTTYMGEHHPAAKKVVVEFTTRELAAASSLSESQRIKLIKLVGVRYNPEKDLVKMSCEKFENAAQNKRYLGDLVSKIIAEAKDETDMFEDVPLDFRHHKPRKVHTFPENWKVNNQEGFKKLSEARERVRFLEDGAPVVDGKEILESYVRSRGTIGNYANPQ